MSRLKKDVRTVRARARVKYGPERSTIKALVGQAEGNLASDLTSADAAAKSAVHFAKKARKPVENVFKEARSQADAAHSDVEAAFGKIGAGADPFRAATAREQANRHQAVAFAGARALNDLTQQQVAAKAGGLYARNQAFANYHKDLSDLQTRLRDLNSRQGDFASQELSSLQDSRAKAKIPLKVAKINQAGQDRRSAQSLENSKELARYKNDLNPKGGTGPGGGKPASRSEARMFLSDFATAAAYAKKFAASGKVGRHDAALALTKGRPGKAATGTDKGVPRTPKIDDQLALSAALDMAYAGYIGDTTANRLHTAGFRVKDIPGTVSRKKYMRHRRGGPHGTGRP
jgi:hypothetical protein